MSNAYLILQNGKIFEGTSFGAEKDAVGELVFHTGMVGYVETLTDPVLRGQMLVSTFPLIGNYGINEADFLGDCPLSAYICREWCPIPSNFRSQYDIDTFLKKQNIPALCGIDTRALTKILREEGTMNAALLHELPADLSDTLAKIADYKVPYIPAVAAEPVTVPAAGEAKFRAALLNLGAGGEITEALTALGCAVTVYGRTASAAEILAGKYDFVVLSRGAGDPADYTAETATVRDLVGKIPVLAFGLGHELLALACGGKIVRLKYGHHGANQPVRDLAGTRTYITAQNHNYAVDAQSVPNAVPRFVNLNDGTCEGLLYPEKHAFSVQFLPETRLFAVLFDAFSATVGGVC